MKYRIISLLTVIAMLAPWSGAVTAVASVTENAALCPACRIVDCGVEHIRCHETGDENCTGGRILGDVNGNGAVDVYDALDVIRYITRMESELDFSVGSCAWNAAVITGGEKPTWADAHEILFNSLNRPCVLRGSPAPTVSSPAGLFRAEIDKNAKVINFYNTAELSSYAHYMFEFTVRCSDLPEDATNQIKNVEYNDICLADSSLTDAQDGYAFAGALSVPNPPKSDGLLATAVPVNSLVMKQAFSGDPTAITVDGVSIKETVMKPHMGDIDGDGKITIFDALEILKRLMGIDSVMSKSRTALLSALITYESQKNGEPTIFDALEILKYLVDMWGQLKMYEEDLPAPDGSMNFSGADITDEQLAVMIKSEQIPRNVSELWLDGNKITDLSPLKKLTRLKYLDLGGNQIVDITPLSELINLAELDLGDNKITDVAPLRGLTNLTKLNLCDNPLADITPLMGLVNLQRLETHGTQIPESQLSELQNAAPGIIINGDPEDYEDYAFNDPETWGLYNQLYAVLRDSIKAFGL